ncbi:MAG: HPP family protein [Candidatus Methanoplasma sp.]|jgi:CBS domain-containing membrane protein|nr:HPP family protein [Candidatus Methanoplasma sp.]
MRLIDENSREFRKNYLLQSLLGAIIVMILVLLADVIVSETVVASLGASAFIAMAMPRSKLAKPRYFIGGYACGILWGIVGNLMLGWFPELHMAVAAGVAVGMTMLFMVLLDFEHPPACALALGLMMVPDPYIASIVAVPCIIAIAAVAHFGKGRMINLV